MHPSKVLLETWKRVLQAWNSKTNIKKVVESHRIKKDIVSVVLTLMIKYSYELSIIYNSIGYRPIPVVEACHHSNSLGSSVGLALTHTCKVFSELVKKMMLSCMVSPTVQTKNGGCIT